MSQYVSVNYVAENYVALDTSPGLDATPYDSAGAFLEDKNGYYDKARNLYLANSTQTWSSYASPLGWNDVDSWNGTPASPLTFVTEVVDTQKSRFYNPICKVEASGPVDITVMYGDSVDSTGAIETPFEFEAGQSAVLQGAKGRYWQFRVSVAQQDAEELVISSITSTIKSETILEEFTDLDTSTITDSAGQGTLVPTKSFGTITSVVFQPQITDSSRPQVFVKTKTTTGIDFEVRDMDTYGKTLVDCTCDVQIKGLPKIQSDVNGNIEEVLA